MMTRDRVRWMLYGALVGALAGIYVGREGAQRQVRECDAARSAIQEAERCPSWYARRPS